MSGPRRVPCGNSHSPCLPSIALFLPTTNGRADEMTHGVSAPDKLTWMPFDPKQPDGIQLPCSTPRRSVEARAVRHQDEDTGQPTIPGTPTRTPNTSPSSPGNAMIGITPILQGRCAWARLILLDEGGDHHALMTTRRSHSRSQLDGSVRSGRRQVGELAITLSGRGA